MKFVRIYLLFFLFAGIKSESISQNKEIHNYFDYVLPLVKKAGQVIVEAKDIVAETKTAIYDLVTVYDRKVEDILIKEIKKEYPNHKFIGEEESSSKHFVSNLTDVPTWVIDPIDGTTNFVRKFPMACISVGLAINKELVMGIIYNPYTEDLYTAIKGEGAFLNGERIRVSGETNIQKVIFGYEISLARREEYYDLYLYRFKHLIKIISGIRSFGTGALSLCYLAQGSIDAYEVDGLYPWDVAAGVVIVREAGGEVKSSNGEEFNLMKPDILATSSKKLMDDMLAVSKIADDERLAAENHKKSNKTSK